VRGGLRGLIEQDDRCNAGRNVCEFFISDQDFRAGVAVM
jgi:hypothetical protein